MRRPAGTSGAAPRSCLLLAAAAVQAAALGRPHRLRGAPHEPLGAAPAPLASGPPPGAARRVPASELTLGAEPRLAPSGVARAGETTLGQWYFPLSRLRSFVLGYWLLLAMSSMIWIMLVVLTAYRYRRDPQYTPEVRPTLRNSVEIHKQLSRWHAEWYQCCEDPRVCFWAFCCPWIRWAHTMDLLHFFDYGPAFAIFLMLQCVNQMTGLLFMGAYFAVLLAHYRQKIRKVFGMKGYGTCAGYTEDCLCMCCCTPCAIAQEAQHVQKAAEMGFPLPLANDHSPGQKRLHHDRSPWRSERYGTPMDDALSAASHSSFYDATSRMSASRNSSTGTSPCTPQHQPQQLVFEELFRNRNRSRSSSPCRASRDGDHGHVVDRGQLLPAPRPQHLVDAKAAATAAAKASAAALPRRCPWIQNPKPERLLARPPVRAGAHGEVSGVLSFVQLMTTFHDDLRAYVFLFAEVGCVGRCVASCSFLHAYIWADRGFWQFYNGSNVNDRLAQPFACPAHALREAFRRWIFHIDGLWARDFRAFVEQARRSPSGKDLSLMLSYARYVASGLMPYDSRPAINDFTGVMCELLAECSPRRRHERGAAEALTAQVECMGEVFTPAQIKQVLAAFDCSLGRGGGSSVGSSLGPSPGQSEASGDEHQRWPGGIQLPPPPPPAAEAGELDFSAVPLNLG